MKISGCTPGNQGLILWSSDTSSGCPMQNDSTTTVIEFAIVDKTIFHLLQAHSDRPLTERCVIVLALT